MFVEILSAEYLEEYKIIFRMNNGRCGIVDLKDELWGSIFEPLKDKTLFRDFMVSKETGTIEWKNGADFAPEFINDKLITEDARTYPV